MRWFHGMMLACGLVAASSMQSGAQDLMIGDVAGYGPYGISNGFGYGARRPPPPPGRSGTHRGNLAARMNALGMHGYYTPLDDPVGSSTGPSSYYAAPWSGINGAPSPDVASRGFGYSPPWSAAYRRGEPRKHKLFPHLHHGD